MQYFTFEHHREYQQVQFKFLDAVESMDPNNIVVCCEIGLPVLLPLAFLQPLSLVGEVGQCIPSFFCQSHFEQSSPVPPLVQGEAVLLAELCFHLIRKISDHLGANEVRWLVAKPRWLCPRACQVAIWKRSPQELTVWRRG